MDLKLIIYLSGGMFLAITAIMIVYLIQQRKKKKKEAEFYFSGGVKKTSQGWVKFYLFFSKFVLTKKYIKNMYSKYQIMFPENLREAQAKTAKVAITIWCLSGAVLAILLSFEMTPYLFACACVTVYFFNDKYVTGSMQKLSKEIVHDFENSLGDIRKYYIATNTLDTAMDEAIKEATPLMRAHLKKMQEILNSADIEGAVQSYNQTVPNRFMKTYMALAATVVQYGDTKAKDGSLFLTSIKHLINDINIEGLNDTETKSKFAGLSYMAIIPIYTVPFIENWGLGVLPELETWFSGAYGIVMQVMIILYAVVVHNVIKWLQVEYVPVRKKHTVLDAFLSFPAIGNIVNAHWTRNYGKQVQLENQIKRVGENLTAAQFMAKQFLWAFVATLASVALLITVREVTGTLATTSMSSVSESTSGATEKNAVSMMVITKSLVNEYKDVDLNKWYRTVTGTAPANSTELSTLFRQHLRDKMKNVGVTIDYSEGIDLIRQYLQVHPTTSLAISSLDLYTNEQIMAGQIEGAAALQGVITRMIQDSCKPDALKLDILMDAVVTATMEKISTYQNQYFKWTDLLIAIAIGVCAFFIPKGIMVWNVKRVEQTMENEVIQIMSVAMILMYIPNMDVEAILIWFELFSTTFKRNFQVCINSLSASVSEALEALEASQPLEQFKLIVQNLMACDKIGVRAAFDGTEDRRLIYQDKRRQDNARRLSQNSTIASALATGSLMFVVVMYLIVPFCIESFSSLGSTMSELGQF